MDSFNREPTCSVPLGELKPGTNETILFKLPWRKGFVPEPSPIQRSPGLRYVPMPFDDNGSSAVPSWLTIVEVLTETKNRLVESIEQLIDLMRSVSPRLERASFNVLRELIEEMDADQRKQLYHETLPCIIDLALQLPTQLPESVPISKQRTSHSVFLSQHQCASILANGFLCTFPRPLSDDFQFFSFHDLFSGSGRWVIKRKLEKLKCIMNYFHRISSRQLDGVISFQRNYLEPAQVPDWPESSEPLRKMAVLRDGAIERDGIGMLQVDFADEMIGGIVLTSGLEQEEVRFIVSPELMVSMLFSERMLDNEAIIMTGAETFNEYTGYSQTFKFAGDFVDPMPLDEWGRRYTKVVAIDAIFFSLNKTVQYSKAYLDRELTKAYVGFMERSDLSEENRSAIATGNWGCGEFNGDPQFKSLIQWIAASIAKRDTVYFTYREPRLPGMVDLISRIMDQKITTGRLYDSLVNYCDHVKSKGGQEPDSVFNYLGSHLLGQEKETPL